MAATPQSFTSPLPPMPDGSITGPDAWRADAMRERDDWVHVLSETEIDEIGAAVEAADTGDRPIAGIGREDFQLPVFGPVLDAIREELLRGRGFVLIRGLPVERYSVRRRAIAYWGIGAWIGRAVSQNAMGHLLGHVIDLGRTNDDYRARTYQTRDRQFFHADSCDVVGLLCIRKAQRGGLSAIVSSVTLYNEMLARSPELTAELFRPIHFDRRGEVPEGQPPWYEHAGVQLVRGQAQHPLRAALHPVHPPPCRRCRRSPLARSRPSICSTRSPRIPASSSGWSSNRGTCSSSTTRRSSTIAPHSRTESDPAERRHLLRLWLCALDGRPLPPAYAGRWGSAEIGNRGGIVVKGAIAHVPLEP